ncbi:UDP binding domain-containing protein, partial [Ralstonia pseudosolanacearum]
GLSFKANIDDLRESPAIEIVQTMVQQQLGTVLVVEPHIKVLPAALQGVELLNAEAALSRADIVVLLVDHQQFRKLDTDRLQSRVVIDTRGMWSAKRIAA